MDKGVRKPSGFGLQGESLISLNLLGFRFLTCPRNEEGITGRIPDTRTHARLLGHERHIEERSGGTALKFFVVSRRVHFPGLWKTGICS